MKVIKQQMVDSNGYTLAELLVVLALGSIILYLSAAAYLFGERFVNKWNNRVKLLNASQVITQTIAEEFYKTETVLDINENYLKIERQDRSIREFERMDGKLSINKKAIAINSAELIHLQFREILREPNSSPANKGNQSVIAGIEAEVSVAAGGDTLTSKRMIMIRKPAMWNRVKE